jgi:hypothetical protein
MRALCPANMFQHVPTKTTVNGYETLVLRTDTPNEGSDVGVRSLFVLGYGKATSDTPPHVSFETRVCVPFKMPKREKCAVVWIPNRLSYTRKEIETVIK